MLYIRLPEKVTERHLPFYLALEEYVARTLPPADYFFLWQVEPTVIFGRNQLIQNEVNVQYCREHGISIYRRKSGGGCVYADSQNLMLSFISPETNVGLAFNRYVGMLQLVLRRLGVDAVGTSHNDVLIDGRKVSGTASYHLPTTTIIHGTLLYDTQMEHMLHAITPGPEKLEKKGIQSVRQRITLLKDYTPLGLEEIKTLIRETLCEGERTLSSEQVAEIEKMKD